MYAYTEREVDWGTKMTRLHFLAMLSALAVSALAGSIRAAPPRRSTHAQPRILSGSLRACAASAETDLLQPEICSGRGVSAGGDG